MHLRVLTLNVWNTEGDPRRLEIISHELHRLDPDLIAFQEVVQTPTLNQLDRLLYGLDRHRTHQNDVQAYRPPHSERYGGSAVATRWPHHLVEAVDLRLADAVDVPWATLAVAVALPNQGELLFVGATAAWRLNAEFARERQALAITDLDARHRRELPTIIAGDFNAAPDSASIRYLTGRQSLCGRSVHYHDAWNVAGDGPGYTWSVENPNARRDIDQIVKQPNHRRRVDYVFVGSSDAHPRAHARVRSARLILDQPVNGLCASDHCGVMVDLDVETDAR
jgi:endonuclease/exonuclease/phosphatase family metal-dependent hydrolase